MAIKPSIPQRARFVPGIEAGMPVREACRTAVRFYLERARACEPGIIADTDSEWLHEYRIAIRQIRSVLGACRRAYPEATSRRLRSAFKQQGQHTNRLRDLDAYLGVHEKYVQALPPALRPGVAPLHARWIAARHEAQRRLVAQLMSAAYRRRMASFERFFSAPDRFAATPAALRPLGARVAVRIRKIYRSLGRLQTSVTADAPETTLHRLRLSCKKLRYLLEYSSGFLPAKPVGRILKSLKRLQKSLGVINDGAVQERVWRLEVGAGSAPGAGVDAASSLALGGLIAAIHERARRERKVVPALLNAVCAKSVRTDLRALRQHAESASRKRHFVAKGTGSRSNRN